MSKNRQRIDVTNRHHLPPTQNMSEQTQIEQYMTTLKKNPFHLLCYDNAPTLHKLILPDGSIAFSIHPNINELLKSLTDRNVNESHNNREIYLSKQQHFIPPQHKSFKDEKHKSPISRQISSKSNSTKQKWTKTVSKIKRERINRAKILPAPTSSQKNSPSNCLTKNTSHIKNKKIQPKLPSLFLAKPTASKPTHLLP